MTKYWAYISRQAVKERGNIHNVNLKKVKMAWKV